jgi:hypothetical protein
MEKRRKFLLNTEKYFSQLSRRQYILTHENLFKRNLLVMVLTQISKRRMASMAGDCENNEEAQSKK